MNHIHGTRRLSVTVAALAVPGFQGTATAAIHRPQHHHAARLTAPQPPNGGIGVAGRLVCPPHLPKCYG